MTFDSLVDLPPPSSVCERMRMSGRRCREGSFARPFAIAVLSLSGAFAFAGSASGVGSQEVTYIANLENGTVPHVRYSGREWVNGQDGVLVGRGTGHQVMMTPPPAAGDFQIEAEMQLGGEGRKSALTLGYESRIVLTAGSGALALEGRFFRAGGKSLAITGPVLPREGKFTLGVKRVGETVQVTVNGSKAYAGPCDPGPLAMLGVDPMEGTVQLGRVSAQGQFSETEEEEFGNPFGMQTRKVPGSAKEVFAPVIVHPGPTNECALVARRDGTLELYHATKPSSDSISVMRSKDGGLTWSASEVAFPLPGKIYYAVMAAEGSDGEVNLVFHVAGQGPGGYRGRLYDVYYTRTKGGQWEKPRLVVPGYVGSIRALIELQSGRLVLSVGRANPDRMEAPETGIDYGWNDVVTYFSDDKGSTWKASTDVLKIPLPGKNATRYGAIEPALVQLGDGKIWMLIRSRDGRFWQSFSEDGTRWSAPERTELITSDSPACFIPLRDKRIVLLVNACQNWTNPRSYAMGGREVLQAAISADDGKTWQGFRDVLHETVGPAGGDCGTAYPSGVETKDGKVCFFSGQGEGKQALVLFDPNWLVQTGARDELADGPVDWVQFGDDKIRVEQTENGGLAVAWPLKSSGLCGAAWNFPATKSGEITFRLWVPKESSALKLALNDHFTRIDDVKATENSVFPITLSEGLSLPAEKWSDITLRWNPREAELLLNGKPVGSFPASRPAVYGVSSLRFEARSASDQGSIKVADLSALQK